MEDEMNRNRILIGLVVLVTAAANMASAGEGEHGRKNEHDKLPAAVLAAVKTACPEGIIKEIELEKEDGQKVYEVELMVGAKSCDLKIAPDGTLVEIERQVDPAELPPKVQATLALFSNSKVVKAEQVQEEGKTSFEVLLKMNEQSFELELSAEGIILEQELKGHDDDDDDDDEDDDDDDEHDDDDDMD